jgi:ferric-dicitrate binding protein FerR (iron transport regulator)
MKELRDWLNEGDPVANDPPLSDADVQRMRHAIVAAADAPHSVFGDWARGSWAAATVVVALTIAAGVNRWFTPLPETSQPGVTAVSTVAAPAAGERRQVQLIAPGGTRVIWIFNADFKP